MYSLGQIVYGLIHNSKSRLEKKGREKDIGCPSPICTLIIFEPVSNGTLNLATNKYSLLGNDCVFSFSLPVASLPARWLLQQ